MSYSTYHKDKTTQLLFFKKNEHNILEPLYGDGDLDENFEDDVKKNTEFIKHYQQIKPTMAAKIYMGSLMIVGLFIVFRTLIKK